MANDDHVALLKKDVDAWNRWRGENPNVVPSLRGALLGGADLRVFATAKQLRAAGMV